MTKIQSLIEKLKFYGLDSDPEEFNKLCSKINEIAPYGILDYGAYEDNTLIDMLIENCELIEDYPGYDEISCHLKLLRMNVYDSNISNERCMDVYSINLLNLQNTGNVVNIVFYVKSE